MAQLERVLSQLRAAAEREGPQWMEDTVQALLPLLPSIPDAVGPWRAPRRARPPERLSPEMTPRARRCRRSPSRDPSVPEQSARRAQQAGPGGIRGGSLVRWKGGLLTGARPLPDARGRRRRPRPPLLRYLTGRGSGPGGRWKVTVRGTAGTGTPALVTALREPLERPGQQVTSRVRC